MSQNITLLGASYSAVPAITLPKTGGGTARFTDVTDTTASASDVAQGKYFFAANGTLTAGTASGGGGDSYTRTIVVPEQTVVAGYGSDDQATLTSVAGLEENEVYVMTYDGTEYVSSCTLMWYQDYVIGEVVHFFQGPTENNFPFGVIWEQGAMYFATNEKTSHTIKVEHLEFIDGPLNLISKSITSNGTYAASSDNADGYSSVTVNVSGGGGGTYQAKTNISPTTSSQTILPDSGYDALSSVQINAMPTGTAGTPTATKGTVSNHSVSVTPKVTNTTGYITGSTKTGTAVTVSASELVSGSETKTANGTYNVTNLASLVVAIPIVTYHTSSSAPTSSQGSDGDLWLVTA